MRRRRFGPAALLVVLALTVLGVAPAGAQPNPYGDGSARTDVVVHADGSYTATLTQRQELVRPYAVTFGGAVHDGFRLAGAGDGFPPYLRGTYEVLSATLDGAAVPLRAEVDRHRVAIRLTRDELPAGVHEVVVVYRVGGAAVPQRDGLRAYVRPLTQVQDREAGPDVTVRTDAGHDARITALSCVAYAPDETPCGTRSGTGWAVDRTDELVDVVADVTAPGTVPAPRLDRG